MKTAPAKKLRSAKMFAAWITVLCFTLTNLNAAPKLYAAPAVPANSEAVQSFETLNFPASIARVENIENLTGQGPAVVVVQDAHSIPDAQRSIRRIILYLEKQYGVDLVGVEGASGDLDTRIFQSYPDQDALKKVFGNYLDKGEMTGSVTAAIFNLKKDLASQNTVFFGVEDWPVYEEGLALYLAALGKEQEISKTLDAEAAQLESQKKKSYSPELLAADKAVTGFHENQQDLTGFLKALSVIQPPKPGSEIALLLAEMQKQGPGNVSVESEVRKTAEQLNAHADKLSADSRKLFNQKRQEFQTSQISAEQFALALKEIAAQAGIELAMSDDLAKLAGNQRRMRDIEGTRFLSDVEAYATAVKEALFKNEAQRDLDQQTHRLFLLKKLARLELSRDDWHELKTSGTIQSFSSVIPVANSGIPAPTSVIPAKAGISEQQDPASVILSRLQSRTAKDLDFKYHRAFYENSEKRDGAFIRNLEKRLKPGKVAVVIAGGFHAQGLAAHLQEKGIRHALVMPAIAKLPEQSAYREHMKGNVAWKDYLEVKNGKINLYEAFVRYTRDRLLGRLSSFFPLSRNAGEGRVGAITPSDPRLLKNWRDQILRDLAAQGKLEKAGEYTRFIDETTNQEKKNRFDEKLKQVDQFIEGLKRLDAEGKFSAANIGHLLKSTADVSGAGLATSQPIVTGGEAAVPNGTFNVKVFIGGDELDVVNPSSIRPAIRPLEKAASEMRTVQQSLAALVQSGKIRIDERVVTFGVEGQEPKGVRLPRVEKFEPAGSEGYGTRGYQTAVVALESLGDLEKGAANVADLMRRLGTGILYLDVADSPDRPLYQEGRLALTDAFSDVITGPLSRNIDLAKGGRWEFRAISVGDNRMVSIKFSNLYPSNRVPQLQLARPTPAQARPGTGTRSVVGRTLSRSEMRHWNEDERYRDQITLLLSNESDLSHEAALALFDQSGSAEDWEAKAREAREGASKQVLKQLEILGVPRDRVVYDYPLGHPAEESDIGPLIGKKIEDWPLRALRQYAANLQRSEMPERGERVAGISEAVVEKNVGGLVWSAAHSPDGKTLAVASYDGRKILLYDLAMDARGKVTGVREEIETSLKERVISISYTPDGKSLVAGTDDNKFYVFHLETTDGKLGLRETAMVRVGGRVMSVSHSSDGKFIAVGTEDGKIQVYNVTKNPEGGILLSAPVVEAEAGVLRVSGVSISPDGQSVAVAGYGQYNQKLHVFNFQKDQDGKVAGMSETVAAARDVLSEYVDDGGILSVAHSPDGNSLAVGTNANKLGIYNLEKSPDGNVSRISDPVTIEVRRAVRSVAFSPDGTSLIAGSDDGKLSVYNLQMDPAGGGVTDILLPALEAVGDANTEIWNVAVHPNGQSVIAGDNKGNLRIHNLERVSAARSEMRHWNEDERYRDQITLLLSNESDLSHEAALALFDQSGSAEDWEAKAREAREGASKQVLKQLEILGVPRDRVVYDYPLGHPAEESDIGPLIGKKIEDWPLRALRQYAANLQRSEMRDITGGFTIAQVVKSWVGGIKQSNGFRQIVNALAGLFALLMSLLRPFGKTPPGRISRAIMPPLGGFQFMQWGKSFATAAELAAELEKVNTKLAELNLPGLGIVGTSDLGTGTQGSDIRYYDRQTSQGKQTPAGSFQKIVEQLEIIPTSSAPYQIHILVNALPNSSGILALLSRPDLAVLPAAPAETPLVSQIVGALLAGKSVQAGEEGMVRVMDDFVANLSDDDDKLGALTRGLSGLSNSILLDEQITGLFEALRSNETLEFDAFELRKLENEILEKRVRSRSEMRGVFNAQELFGRESREYKFLTIATIVSQLNLSSEEWHGLVDEEGPITSAPARGILRQIYSRHQPSQQNRLDQFIDENFARIDTDSANVPERYLFEMIINYATTKGKGDRYQKAKDNIVNTALRFPNASLYRIKISENQDPIRKLWRSDEGMDALMAALETHAEFQKNFSIIDELDKTEPNISLEQLLRSLAFFTQFRHGVIGNETDLEELIKFSARGAREGGGYKSGELSAAIYGAAGRQNDAGIKSKMKWLAIDRLLNFIFRNYDANKQALINRIQNQPIAVTLISQIPVVEVVEVEGLERPVLAVLKAQPASVALPPAVPPQSLPTTTRPPASDGFSDLKQAVVPVEAVPTTLDEAIAQARKRVEALMEKYKLKPKDTEPVLEHPGSTTGSVYSYEEILAGIGTRFTLLETSSKFVSIARAMELVSRWKEISAENAQVPVLDGPESAGGSMFTIGQIAIKIVRGAIYSDGKQFFSVKQAARSEMRMLLGGTSNKVADFYLADNLTVVARTSLVDDIMTELEKVHREIDVTEIDSVIRGVIAKRVASSLSPADLKSNVTSDEGVDLAVDIVFANVAEALKVRVQSEFGTKAAKAVDRAARGARARIENFTNTVAVEVTDQDSPVRIVSLAEAAVEAWKAGVVTNFVAVSPDGSSRNRFVQEFTRLAGSEAAGQVLTTSSKLPRLGPNENMGVVTGKSQLGNATENQLVVSQDQRTSDLSEIDNVRLEKFVSAIQIAAAALLGPMASELGATAKGNRQLVKALRIKQLLAIKNSKTIQQAGEGGIKPVSGGVQAVRQVLAGYIAVLSQNAAAVRAARSAA